MFKVFKEIYETVTKPNASRKLRLWSNPKPFKLDELDELGIDDSNIINLQLTCPLSMQEAVARLEGSSVDMRYLLIANRKNKIKREMVVGRKWTLGASSTNVMTRVGTDWGTVTVNVHPTFAGILTNKKDKAFLESMSNITRAFSATSGTTVDGAAKRAAYLVEKGNVNMVRLVYRLAKMYAVATLSEKSNVKCTIDGYDDDCDLRALSSLNVFEDSLKEALTGRNYIYYEQTPATPGSENALSVYAAALDSPTYGHRVRRCAGNSLLSFWPDIGRPVLLYKANVPEEQLRSFSFTSLDIHTAANELLTPFGLMEMFSEAVREMYTLSAAPEDADKLLGLDDIEVALPKMDTSVLAAGIMIETIRQAELGIDYHNPVELQEVALQSTIARAEFEVCHRTALIGAGGLVDMIGQEMDAQLRRAQYVAARPSRTVNALTRQAASIKKAAFAHAGFGRLLSTTCLIPYATMPEVHQCLKDIVTHAHAVQWEETALWATSLPYGNTLTGLVNPMTFDATKVKANEVYKPVLDDVTTSDAHALQSLYNSKAAVGREFDVAYLTTNTARTLWTHNIERYSPKKNYRGAIADMQFMPYSNEELHVSMPVLAFRTPVDALAYANDATLRREYTWYIDMLDVQYISMATALNTVLQPSHKHPISIPGDKATVMSVDLSAAGSAGSSSATLTDLDSKTEYTQQVRDSTHQDPLEVDKSSRMKIAAALDDVAEQYYKANGLEPSKWLKNFMVGVAQASTGPEEANRASSLSNVHSILTAWDPVEVLKELPVTQRSAFMENMSHICRAAVVYASPIQASAEDFSNTAERFHRMATSLRSNPGLTVEEANSWWTNSYRTQRNELTRELRAVQDELDATKRNYYRNPRKRNMLKDRQAELSEQLQLLKNRQLSQNAGDEDVQNAFKTGRQYTSLLKLSQQDVEKRKALQAEAERQAEELLARLDMSTVASMKAAGLEREELVAMGYPVTQEIWDSLDLEEVAAEETRLAPIQDEAPTPMKNIEELADYYKEKYRSEFAWDAEPQEVLEHALTTLGDTIPEHYEGSIPASIQILMLGEPAAEETKEESDFQEEPPTGSSGPADPPAESVEQQGVPPPKTLQFSDE
ncbi:hypothetical protein RVD_123 [viral metagenome]